MWLCPSSGRRCSRTRLSSCCRPKVRTAWSAASTAFLRAALACCYRTLSVQEMLLRNRPDLMLLAQGKVLCAAAISHLQCLLQAAAAAASYMHTAAHHKLLPAGVRPMGPASGGRLGPDPRAGDRRPLGRGNPREDRSVLFIREVNASAALLGSSQVASCATMVGSLFRGSGRFRYLTHVDAEQIARLGDGALGCCPGPSPQRHAVLPSMQWVLTASSLQRWHSTLLPTCQAKCRVCCGGQSL